MSTELRPTPETDDAARKGAYHAHGEYPETCGKQIVHIDFARRLERERDSAKTLNRTLLDQLEAQAVQLEAMREAIGVASAALEEADGSSYHVEGDACLTKSAKNQREVALAKLQPFLTP